MALTTCTELPPTVISTEITSAGVPAPPPATLAGIKGEPGYQPSDPIRIFVTHGMGTDWDPQDSAAYCALATVIDGVTRDLNAVQDAVDSAGPHNMCGNLAVPPSVPIAVLHNPSDAQVYRFHFHKRDTGSPVRIDYLVWSPLTGQFKPSLNETGHPSWALSQELFKSFVQTHVSDVVIYGGSYRTVIREAIEEALCEFVGGAFDAARKSCNGNDTQPNERVVLITHSLGGYMLMDSLVDLREAHAQRPTHDDDAGWRVLARTHLIFMLANQLALLDLTTEPVPAGLTAPSATRAAEGRGMLALFLGHWHASHGGVGDGDLRQIVAVSDPNDWLSWFMSTQNIGQTYGTVSANVYLGTTPDVAGVAAWPVSAHLNYLTDPRVADIIVCGMAGDAIYACPK